jgi:ABC-type spermidine/putrescine transport system permease subunit II
MWDSRWTVRIGRRLLQAYAIAAAVLLAYPTVQLFIVAASDDIVFPPRYFSLNAFNPDRLPALLEWMPFSLALGLATTAVLLALAIPMCYATQRMHFRGRALASAAVFLPVIIPGVGYMVALGTAYILVFPDLIGSFWGILLPTVVFNLVWMVRAIQSSLSVTDPAYEDAALMLGASRVRAFFSITLPAIMPGIAVGSMVTFANSATAFTAPFFLGRTTALTTTVGIFNELSRNSLIPRIAAEALVVELIVMTFVVAAYIVARKRFRGLII